MYKGCYVLMKNDDTENTFTLMSPKCLTLESVEDLETVVNDSIAKLAVDGVTGWHLANMVELNYMREEYSTIATNIAKLIEKGKDVEKFDTNGVLYCFRNSEGKIKSCLLPNEQLIENPSRPGDILRAFATITYPE